MAATSGTLVANLVGHNGAVNDVLYLAGSRVVFSCSDDKTFAIWLPDPNTGGYAPSVMTKLNKQCSALAWDANRRRLLVGKDDGGIQVVTVGEDFRSTTLGDVLPMHSSRVAQIIYDPVNDWILSVGHDKKLRLYDYAANKMYATKAGDSWLSALAFDAHSKRAFVGTFQQTIECYDLTEFTPKLKATLSGHLGSIRSLAYDPAHQTLYSGSFDLTVICWDIGEPGREVIAKLGNTLMGHTKKIKAVCWSPTRQVLISTGDDSSIRVWEPQSGDVLANWTGHRTPILCASWCDEEGILVTGSNAKEIKIWSVPDTGRPGQPTTSRPASSVASPAVAAAPARTAPAVATLPVQDDSEEISLGGGGAARPAKPVSDNPFDDI